MLVGVLVVNALLARAAAGIGSALGCGALELVLGSTAGIVLRANVGGEAGVRSIILEATLGQVGPLGFGLAVLSGIGILAGGIGDVRGGLATVILAVATAAGLRLSDTKLILGGGRATNVAGLGHMGTGVVALAAQGLGVPLLAI